MSFFKDSVFENLDDISQMVEPFQCKFNDELHKLPDRIDLDYNEIMKWFGKDTLWGGFGTMEIDSVLKAHNHQKDIDWDLITDKQADKFFKFQIGDGEEDEQCYLDVDNKRLTNTITLIKHKSGFDDEELYKMMIENLKHRCWRMMRKPSLLHKGNINEIADVFDIDGVYKERAMKPKRDKLLNGLVEQFNDRKINIRNFELGLRFAKWITSYICNNNAAAIKNITLFKVMMLNERPIYSIDNEEQL